MRRLEEDMQIHARFIALVLLKNSRDDGARETGLVRNEGESLRRQNAGVGLLRGWCFRDGGFSAANREHVGGNRHADGRSEAIQPKPADREPPPGIEQVAGVIPNIGELEPRHWAIVGAFELTFVFKRQSCGGVFGQSGWQWNSNGRVLGYSLGRELLILFVEHLRSEEHTSELQSQSN